MSDQDLVTSDFTDDEASETGLEVMESDLENSYTDTDDESDIEQETGKRKSNVKRVNTVRKKELGESESNNSSDIDHEYSIDVKHPNRNHDIQSSLRTSLDNNLTSEDSENELKESNAHSIYSKSRQSLKKDGLSGSRSVSNFIRRKSHEIESDDSEEDVGRIAKTKATINIIDSDTSESENENIIESTNSGELSLQSIINTSGESNHQVDNITEKLNNSRISNEFNFGAKGSIINSTILDTASVLDTPPISTKRSLNRSADTPRIIKQMKEYVTPKNSPSRIPQSSLQGNDPMLTPRNVKEVIPSRSPSPESSSVEILSDVDDIVDISSEERNSPIRVIPPARFNNRIVKQTTLDSMIKKNSSNVQESVKRENDAETVLEVSPKEFQDQKEKIKKIETDLFKANNLMRTVNMDSLPDKGRLIKQRHADIEQMLKLEAQKLSKMRISKEDAPGISKPKDKVMLSWEEIEAKAGAVLPKTFGKQAMSTYNAQKAVTMDRLQQLHGSLESCPTEDTLADDPKGLKVELMLHQKRALAWLMWREKQKPSGGILADDMGLGKTLTMISLMLKMMELKGDDDDSENENPQNSKSKYNGGTLIVCPASLINQWSGELERRTKRGLASCELYHGAKRETNAKKLAEHDMVVTTYAIVMNEYEKQGAVFRVKWRRIVIDEAHQIRNHKSQTSVAVCHLAAKSRWALTGTPVHNKELDMYALLKFLRCTPFDDIMVWKRWVGDKSTGGQERLHTVISSLMLRRTKVELMEKGTLNSMPERKWELIPVDLNKSEMDIYQRILIFSRTMFAQFLHQRAEKNQDAADLQYANFQNPPGTANEEYFKMRQKLLRLHKVKDIEQHEILVLLLRLRQICCHPSLITGMLHEEMEDLDGEEPEELSILDQLNKLALDDKFNPNVSDPAQGLASQEEAPGLKEAARGLLNPSNPVFSKERLSSKVKVLLDVIKEKIVTTNDKAIIVSQWPSFLRLIAYHLKENGIPFDQLDGTIPVHKRMVMVDSFNDPKDKMKILLLSLTAGGVGLNLVGANYLFLLDLHWNPQLENQAQDRIYRVGQQKPVFVYKFMATDTIEKRILDLQEKKLDIANSMLTGTKQVIGSKLSLQDLKMLFDM